MNELKAYNCTDYHINQTNSVFVTLEGTMLRLQRPKNNVSHRAFWNEGPINVSFVHQRHFDLVGSQICLLPTQLVKKRLWSKKYPICIALANVPYEDHKPLNNSDDLVDEDKQTLLYLFARTGREKEEWYRRCLAASQSVPLPTSIKEIIDTNHKIASKMIRQGSLDSNLSATNIFSNVDIFDIECSNSNNPHAHLAAYLTYMAHVMPSESVKRLSPGTRIKQLMPLNQDQCDTNIMFVNAIIARMFWDFLRKDYWIGKMTEKIQRKLSKIHVSNISSILYETTL